jgi:glycosyltransferase involved in cell wall biosynthesis
MNQSLNILLTNSTDIYGGGEFFVYELAKALLKRNHKVWVCCKPDNLLFDKCKKVGIPAIPVDFPSKGKLLKHILRLKKIILEKNISIVHSNSNYDRTAGAFAARLAGVKHITNVHSFHSLQHNLTHWIRNKFATDHFIVDGVCVENLLVKHDGISPSKISVVYLGVNPEEMKRDENLRNKIRSEFGLSNDQIVIGNVGRFVLMKGQEFLLRAFAEASKNYPFARLLIVGDGELNDKLHEIVEQAKIQDQVIFAGFRDDLQAVYSAFDIYVHSSVEGGGETFPFAVLQALAQQLPVVVTNVGDVAVMVEDKVNGYVVPDRSASLLAEKIVKLLADNNLRNSMAIKSRERLLDRFTTDKMVDAIEKVYFSLADKN